MRIPMLAAAVMVTLMPLSTMAVDDFESRLKLLETELGRQSDTIRQQQKIIEGLKQQTAEQAGIAAAKPAAVSAQSPEDSASKLTGLFSGSLMTNPYISLVLDTKGYVSNLKNGGLNARGGLTFPGYGYVVNVVEFRGHHNQFIFKSKCIH